MSQPNSIYLTIPQVIGGSQDPRYPEAIELLSCSNLDSYPAGLHDVVGTEARGYQIKLGSFQVSKAFDLSSNSLRRSLWQGEILSEVKIEVVNNQQALLSIQFDQVLLESINFQITTHAPLTENVSFTYGEVKYIHHVYKSDGSKRGETTAETNLLAE